jgi:hypothetical protein
MSTVDGSNGIGTVQDAVVDVPVDAEAVDAEPAR